jgi:hypothetical protein
LPASESFYFQPTEPSSDVLLLLCQQGQLLLDALITSICRGYLDLVEMLVSRGATVDHLPDAVSS